MSYELVWFKRDLRIQDHAALTEAAQRGPVRCIYIVEPKLWEQPDTSLQHFEFIQESLKDLHDDLQSLGGGIEIYQGEATEVLSQIYQNAPFTRLYSHEETGNDFTYQRDKRVAQWCRHQGILWLEFPQFGVVRGLKKRNDWQQAWELHMSAPIKSLGAIHFWNKPKAFMRAQAPINILQHNPPLRQRGGRVLAQSTLQSFLQERSYHYRGGISSPLIAPNACSRLSAYLAYGCISMREVVQQTRVRISQLESFEGRQRAGLLAFVSRLYWHCHFIQKLESEPEIEWQNMHSGYDGLRESEFNQAYFEALKAGRTGWPMVDACVVMLRETGWLNFRMRAMLVSVAAYPLWLHWRPVGEWLATQFLDYEPGIHWSQHQMQSGTTGINTTRVYNPIKQAQDQDPKGEFVRYWLPYMKNVPDTWLFQPWLMTQAVQENIGLKIGEEIPAAVVDLTLALKHSKDRLHARRQNDKVKSLKQAVLDKHVSKQNNFRSRSPINKKTITENTSTEQLGFDF
jgi:deoxyribodipyrimidine photo-lyase